MEKIHADDLCGRLGITKFAESRLAKTLKRLPALGASGPWVAGGAVRRTMQGEKLDSDYDFFFATSEQADAFEHELSVLGATERARTDKATTYLLPAEAPEEGVYLPELRVQAIRFAYFADVAALLDAFDFTICQFAYDGENVYAGTFSLWDVAKKRLVIHRVTYGVSSIRRLLKYTSQGYTVCSGALAELLKQVVADPQVIQSSTEYID